MAELAVKLCHTVTSYADSSPDFCVIVSIRMLCASEVEEGPYKFHICVVRSSFRHSSIAAWARLQSTVQGDVVVLCSHMYSSRHVEQSSYRNEKNCDISRQCFVP